jgi:hypothetical protein
VKSGIGAGIAWILLRLFGCYIHCSVADSQHVNNVVRFINFVDGAIDVGLVSIEQMVKGSFRPPALRRNGTSPGEAREAIHCLLKAVEQTGYRAPGCG